MSQFIKGDEFEDDEDPGISEEKFEYDDPYYDNVKSKERTWQELNTEISHRPISHRPISNINDVL